MRIGFDLDGVIVDFNKGFYNELKKFKDDIPPQEEMEKYFYWEYSVPEDGLKPIINQIFDRNQDFWKNLDPCQIKEITRINKLIADDKHDIYFITSRNPKTVAATRRWLNSFFGSDYHLICGANSKGLICQGLNLHCYIDDRYVFAYEIARNSKTRSYLLRTEVNSHLMGLESQGITIVPSVGAYLDEVLT